MSYCVSAFMRRSHVTRLPID